MLNDKELQQYNEVVQKSIRQELEPIKEDIKKIRQNQQTISNFFDSEYLELRHRVEKLEQIVASIT